MNSVLYDVRYAARGLRRTPVFTAVIALTLGVGVGVNSALFSALNRLLLRPPDAVVDPGDLVRVRVLPAVRSRGLHALRQAASYQDYVVLKDSERAFAQLAAYSGLDASLGGGLEAEPVRITLVSGNYFAALSVPAHLGRVLTESDVTDGGDAAVTVLSYGFWQRRFGGRRDILGERITLNQARLTVIGIARQRFAGVDVDSPDMWLPLSVARDVGLRWTSGTTWLRLFGRLKSGLSREAAASAARVALHPGVRADFVEAHSDDFARVAIEGISFFTADPQDASPVPLWMLAVTAFVLLIACANIANLLLVRAGSRQREMAVRLALGATRAQLVRQLLTEAILLAGLGALVGLLLTTWSVGLFRILSVPRMSHLVDTSVLIFTAGLSIVTVGLFGLVPAMRATEVGASEALRTSHASPFHSRLRDGLVIMQVVFSLMLLVGTTLLVRSLRIASGVDAGFDLGHLLTVSVPLQSSGYGAADAWELHQRALGRVAKLPDVASASYGQLKPFYSFSILALRIPADQVGADQSPSAFSDVVDTGYFRTLQIPLRAGRVFNVDDRHGTERVAVINEAMAAAYWADADPIGQCFIIAGPCLRIVGVVGSARTADLRREPAPQFYEPLAQHPEAQTSPIMFVRTKGDPAKSLAAVRNAVQSIDPGVPFVMVTPLTSATQRLMAPLRVRATLFGVLGALAFVLCGIGLYSVMAYNVVQRTHEVGVRMAMGATRSDIVRLVLKQGLRVTGIGLALGLPAALGMARFLSSQLYRVRPTDPSTYLMAIGVLTVAALAASYLPASRAAKVDPTAALRQE